MDEAVFDPMVTAVRVFTTRNRHRPRQSGSQREPKRRYPYEVLVFDTETLSGPDQQLMVGVWRFYRDDSDHEAGLVCIEEGFFHPDDLPHTDPDGYATVLSFAAGRHPDIISGFERADAQGGIPVWPLSRWLEKRFYRYGFRHRNRCDVVGFNLLFDLGRLASYWGEGNGHFRGGWSLGLWGSYDQRGRWKDDKFHPRLRAKSIDPRRTLFAWGTIKDDPDPHLKGNHGRFVDLRALTFALTDRSHTLESACRAFGIAFQKEHVEYGRITDELLAYALDDVAATSRLYRACLDELDKHEGVDLPPQRLYSPATVGVRYLEAMGLERPMDKFKLDPRIHGWAMSGFFGGRVEARIVRTPVPVAYVDATSMYPTVNALLDTWRILTAERLELVDVTDRVIDLLGQKDLYDRCFTPAFWADEIGVTLVEVDHPDGDILPVRGEYDETASTFGVGLNPVRYNGTLWYALPDVISSTILTRQPTPIRRAIRLQPHGTQKDLRPVKLRGGPMLDPSHDPFVPMIELRHRTRHDQQIPEEQRDRLSQFLKITANATAFGILARFDRRNLSKPVDVTVHGPDEPFDTRTATPEDPGPYCFPPVAATITAAARLMLAMLERAVTDAGGTYAFCDTDSMGIVSHPDPTPIPCPTPDGTDQITPLTPGQVRTILERFQPLNPYDPDLIPKLWTEEHDSLHTPMWCYAISAKRYALYRSPTPITPTLEGLELVDWSEISLGAYLNPLPDTDGDRSRWIRDAWEWIITANGDRTKMPDWADRYALTQFSLSGPAMNVWFTGYNRNRPHSQRIRPGSFGLLAHTDSIIPTLRSARPRPTAVYDSDPNVWPHLNWYDRTDGQPIVLTTLTPRDPDFSLSLARGETRIRTLGDVLTDHRRRPEHKSLAPDGQPATGHTRGLLRRRPIESAPVLTDLIGKEGNLLDERATGLVVDTDDHTNTYGTRTDRFTELVLPILRQMGIDEIAKRTGRKKSAIYDVLSGKLQGRGAPAAHYRDAAVQYATEQLKAAGIRTPRHPHGLLYTYLRPDRPA